MELNQLTLNKVQSWAIDEEAKPKLKLQLVRSSCVFPLFLDVKSSFEFQQDEAR